MAGRQGSFLCVLILILTHFRYALGLWIEQFNQSSQVGLWGDATLVSEYVGQLQLNQALNNSIGRALYNNSITICKNNTPISFSTNFTFQIKPGNGTKGDGFAFFLTPHYAGIPEGSLGKFFGLLNDSQNKNNRGDFVAIEFDTYRDEFDINDNHVGVDATNGTSIKAKDPGISLTGDKLVAFVEYWGKSSKSLKICVNYYDPASLSGRCTTPTLEVKIDLCSLLKTERVYMGFSGGTGGGIETHNIFSWGFAPGIPSIRSKFHKRLVIAASVAACFTVLVCAGAGFFYCRRKNQHRALLGTSLRKNPHKFSYTQLKTATKGFNKDGILGSGGYGTVYKGILKDKSLVAVKCIKKRTEEGDRSFLAEASIVGGLEHRNLVRLKGWCEHRRELLLVFEFMPNGSLDSFLFKNSNVLTWDRRFSIICDLAAAIHYLHRECTEPVVHRDIKCSNILLDSDFTAKLGDFGLARLAGAYEDLNMTTAMGGTFGYISPELVDTRKPTPASDMYSFGVVVLEIVSGRRALTMKGKDVEVLVDYVEQMFQQHRLLEVVDPKLQGLFVTSETQQMLMLGISCVLENPHERMTILDAINVLKHTRQMSSANAFGHID